MVGLYKFVTKTKITARDYGGNHSFGVLKGMKWEIARGPAQ